MPATASKGDKKRKSTRSKKGKIVSNNTRADTLFPVGRLTRMLRRYNDRVGISAGCFMAATLQYITAEIMDFAGEISDEEKKKTILPRHLCKAVREDILFSKLMASATIIESSVPDHIETFLLPKKKQKEIAEQGGVDASQAL